ncbi:YheC/YheD family endospore coat-associated protein [Paenibacillus gansuensis]|uniref:YheC/YheD family protein n=1 Tax=Paenibacillus gansuensis TaxID=306542 RepID=A0ABW5PF33_9BACL
MSANQLTRYVGIMICETGGPLPFPERGYFKEWCLLGEQMGMTVFVFSPQWVRFESKRVAGYTYTRGSGWAKRLFPLPEVLYDRCYYSSKPKYDAYAPSIRKLRSLKDIRFMGYGLKGKWDVQQALAGNELLQQHLPYTEVLQYGETLLPFLQERGEAFLKPHAGSHGKGTMHIAQTAPGYFEVSGRNEENQLFRYGFSDETKLLRWVLRFAGSRRYLIQEYLDLNTREGHPFDIRSLVQKDGRGMWRMTGTAVRVGKRGGVTSNLHGGGSAEETAPFLTGQFGEEQAKDLMETIGRLSSLIPETLEHYHGRLAELGIDLGIDAEGRVWILEVNSKPGRAVFKNFADPKPRSNSVRHPIQYARYLLDRQLGG